ncbi:hypothetical protein [Wenyingzhuangia aestuarii]|uniref:hypothetical protein n=1 Tax=Wenyingzhuangia aestuarii TaxID=1647582 RepID=UPI00143A84CA|nr:hypothetical protein [Wenyingzhuangia aestuarii]NJB83603.1 hypothetical protein [Wenyingzhuangia aestuarii]
MFWSKNDFFKKQHFEGLTQRFQRLEAKYFVLKRLLEIKKFHKNEISLFLSAYDYFIEHPTAYDGATIVKDVYDIPKLEVSAMLHDYQYLVYLPSYSGKSWFKAKKTYDKQYCNNLIRFGKIKHERVAQIRYALLRISTPIYWLIK